MVELSNNLSTIQCLSRFYSECIYILIIDAEIGDEGIISFSENMKYLPNLTKLRLNSINDIIRK